jgi:hypothetical protein
LGSSKPQHALSDLVYVGFAANFEPKSLLIWGRYWRLIRSHGLVPGCTPFLSRIPVLLWLLWSIVQLKGSKLVMMSWILLLDVVFVHLAILALLVFTDCRVLARVVVSLVMTLSAVPTSAFRSRSKGPMLIPQHINWLLPFVVADSASSFNDTKINKVFIGSGKVQAFLAP